MGVFDRFSDVFSAAGQKARRAYDDKKLEMRIRSYEKELKDAYAEIGRMVYQTQKSGAAADNEQLNECFSNIDNLAFRINQLNKMAQERKKQGEASRQAKGGAEQQTGDLSEVRAFAKLARKEGDLKIRRTSNGIQVLRFCAACGYGNMPTDERCAGCGYVFKATGEGAAGE